MVIERNKIHPALVGLMFPRAEGENEVTLSCNESA